jgi:hypothetical protein
MATLRDDITDSIAEVAGRKSEPEIAAEATFRRLQEDKRYAAALRRLLPKQSGKPVVRGDDDG